MEVEGAGVIHVPHFSVVVNFTGSASLALGSGVVGWLKSLVLPSLLLLGSLSCALHCCGQRAGIAGTLSGVPSVLPPL